MHFHITKMDLFLRNIIFNRLCSILTDFQFHYMKMKKNLLNRSEKNCFIKKMNNTNSFIKMCHSGWGNGYAIPYHIHVIFLITYTSL